MDNPLKTNPAREHRVRERAYHLWEADGKPHGRDVEYWERARELVAMEDNPGTGLLPNPQSHPDLVRQADVGEADIQENLGEFPGRMTDQGDVKPAPAPRRSPSRQRKAPAPAPKKPKRP